MRMTRHALVLAVPFLLVGCKGTENLVGTPSNLLEARTVESMKPKITRSLTPQGALDAFGSPESRSTLGEIVFIYNVEDSKKVSLGFPSLVGQILFARVSDRNGASTELPILP